MPSRLSGVPRSRALVLLGVAAGAAGMGVGISSTHSTPAPPPAATAATTAPSPPTTTTAAPPPAPTTTTAPAPPAKPAPAPTATAAPAPTVRSGTWPARFDGYTDVLLSIAVSAGRAQADARARAAHKAGLPGVGVLLSSRFSSLRPGYWVVFSGVYETAAAAQKGLANARLRGFTDVYPRRIAQ